MRTAKTLIRLGGYLGWSESSLGAYALLVLSWGGSYVFAVRHYIKFCSFIGPSSQQCDTYNRFKATTSWNAPFSIVCILFRIKFLKNKIRPLSSHAVTHTRTHTWTHTLAHYHATLSNIYSITYPPPPPSNFCKELQIKLLDLIER